MGIPIRNRKANEGAEGETERGGRRRVLAERAARGRGADAGRVAQNRLLGRAPRRTWRRRVLFGGRKREERDLSRRLG